MPLMCSKKLLATNDYWVGKKFDLLLVVENLGGRKLRVLCDCGSYKVVWNSNLGRGNTTSCGCIHKEMVKKSKTMHGHTKNYRNSATYIAWSNMKTRCLNKKYKEYSYYGGRGISICKRWLESFECFLEDMGEKPSDQSIDRINNDGNYEPSNCRWSTNAEQCANRRIRIDAVKQKKCAQCSNLFRPKKRKSNFCCLKCFGASIRKIFK